MVLWPIRARVLFELFYKSLFNTSRERLIDTIFAARAVLK